MKYFRGFGGQAAPRPGTAREGMTVDYAALARTIAALSEGETDEVELMATMVAEVHHSDDRFDWTGFYRVTGPEMLKIGPFQGGHGCLTIPFFARRLRRCGANRRGADCR